MVAGSTDGSAAEVSVRLQLASVLAAAERYQEALDECVLVLVLDPANAGALEIAGMACQALGLSVREQGYRTLLRALEIDQETVSSQNGETRDEAPPGDSRFDRMLGPNLRLVTPAEHPVEPDSGTCTPVRLADVAGMAEVKRSLEMRFLAPLRDPRFRDLYGVGIGGGLLLFGPPGCGKTFIARALSGDLGARFIPIGLNDVLDMYLGESERRLHELFETARRNAPAVLFFDEVDALGHKRSRFRSPDGRNIVNQLLAEMDGASASNEGVFVLGATNHPWDVDIALTRPGRFDRAVFVAPPDVATRAAILERSMSGHGSGRPDLSDIAERAREFSGADLVHLVRTATEFAMEEAISSGHPRPAGTGDLRRALKSTKPTTRAWFETARNFVMFANESGMYDDVAAYMRTHKLG